MSKRVRAILEDISFRSNYAKYAKQVESWSSGQNPTKCTCAGTTTASEIVGLPTIRRGSVRKRQSDIKLTMKVYCDPMLFDLKGAVESIPAVPSVAQPPSKPVQRSHSQSFFHETPMLRETLSFAGKVSAGDRT